MCQRGNNPTIKQTTAEGHQQVFNAARIPHPVASFSWPLKKYIYTSSVIMNAIMNWYDQPENIFLPKFQWLISRKQAHWPLLFLFPQLTPFQYIIVLWKAIYFETEQWTSVICRNIPYYAETFRTMPKHSVLCRNIPYYAEILTIV